jgi:hypothetical protein
MTINPRVALKKISVVEKKIDKKVESAKPQAKEQADEKDDSDGGESDADRTDDTESESPEISYSEDDDEDDLDFSVNDRFGQKKLTKRQRRKIAARKARKNEKQQPQECEMDVSQEADTSKEIKVRKTKSPKKGPSRTNSFKDANPVVPAITPPTIPKKNIVIYPSAIQETSGIQKSSIGNVVIVKTQKNSPNFGNPGFKTIIDRQVVGGMVVLNKKTVAIVPNPENPTKIAPETSKIVLAPKIEKKPEALPETVRKTFIDSDKKIDVIEDIRFTEFVPLTSEIIKTKIPAQISVQTHQSSQDLVNDLMGFETPAEATPETPSAPQSVVSGSMDLDDGLPEDVLQHVAELVEHKEIQEIIDKVQSFPDLSQLTEGADSTLNTSVEVTAATSSTISVSTPSTPQSSSLDLLKEKTPISVTKKTPIRVVRSDGRVIELPPIEAPATRSAKRRLQGSESSTSPALNPPSASKIPKIEKAASVKEPQSQSSSRRSSLAKSEKDGTLSGKSSRRQSAVVTETDEMDSDATWNSEDDPDRLWCICKQPHNNRFMICCDKCEDWFHGKCVNITKSKAREMEEKGKEWTCPNCKAKIKEGKDIKPVNQPKLTKFFTKHQKGADEVKAAPGMCVICKVNPARNDSVYCSDECIRNHANKHMDEPKKSATPTTPLPPGASPLPHSSHSHHHHHSSHSSSSSSSTPQHAKKDSSASNSPALNISTKSGENKKFSNILKDKNNKVRFFKCTFFFLEKSIMGMFLNKFYSFDSVPSEKSKTLQMRYTM